ncbi:RnfABCDGE type electron transport complex subunit C [Proteiniclasticum sp.]|uniref:RnfABCDGE type electron transport complex subunit C n=1 Tax=Proteiniclasticum sp. TaxID=2053595 RepID=UPI0028995E37|nr:RnfABCDGE type electron transport complex subunit C [Proteiniclasticum sp.]
MSILIGPMKLHLNGHKELTNHGEVKNIVAGKKVYIPLMACTDILVNAGDYVKAGTMLAKRNDHFTVPIFSSVSGKVLGIEELDHSTGRMIEHLVIENDGKFDFEKPFEPMDAETASVEELVNFMMNAGIVGCGGAGFPSYVKYRGAKGIHTLLINAVECEPYITADYRIIDNQVEDLIYGTKAMLKMSGAKEALIAIKKTKKDLIDKVREALKGQDQMKVTEVPDQYPMGWERTLIYEVFKKRYDKLPGEIGVIVNNATTAIAFSEALKYGRPIMEKICTISGDGLKSPSNVRVPVGVSVKDIVEQIGGYAAEEVRVIGGGPMMGRTQTTDEVVITTSSNAITVLKPEPVDTIACLRCGRCNDHCPAGILPVRINNAEEAGDIKMLTKLRADQCIECGMCTYVCPSKIEVTEGVRRGKALLRAAAQK